MSDSAAMASPVAPAEILGPLGLAVKAERSGGSDSRIAATEAWSATRIILARLLYRGGYALSYGVVFPATLVVQAIPRDTVAFRGLRDGAEDAVLRADQVRGQSA